MAGLNPTPTDTLAMAPPFPQGRPSTVAPEDVGQHQQDQIPFREKRHCWECMRRRLVCDSAPGACNKCKNRGVVCPGYDDKKPLRWLTPGKVLSKPRRPKNTAAAGDAASVTSLVPRATSQKKKTTKSKPRDESQTVKSATPAIHLEQSAIERYQLHRSDVSDIVQAVAFCMSNLNLAACQDATHHEIGVLLLILTARIHRQQLDISSLGLYPRDHVDQLDNTSTPRRTARRGAGHCAQLDFLYPVVPNDPNVWAGRLHRR